MPCRHEVSRAGEGRHLQMIETRSGLGKTDPGCRGIEQNADIGRLEARKFPSEPHDVEMVDTRAGKLPEERSHGVGVDARLRAGSSDQFPKLVIVDVRSEIEHVSGAIQVGGQALSADGPAGVRHPRSVLKIDGIEGGGFAGPGVG